MFGWLRRKSRIPVNYSSLCADMHSHLIPGIDDGAPDMETALELIQGMADLGFKKLITTPHIMWDMYQNTPARILEKLEELRAEVKNRGIEITISAGAEYFMDDYFKELVDNKEPLMTIHGKMVLVEFSMASPPFDLKEILFEMQLQGYTPIIAHPERYIYLERNRDFYIELKAAGYLFQLNLLSLAGFYGKSSVDLANHLIHQDFYDLVGTDLHSFRHLGVLSHPVILSNVNKLLAKNRLLNPTL